MWKIGGWDIFPDTKARYQEGVWTPVLTAETPGNLSVVYTTQNGIYTKIGRAVAVIAAIATSTFTHSSAAGAVRITGLPFSADPMVVFAQGLWAGSGWTKTGYTCVSFRSVAATTRLEAVASGSGSAFDFLNITDCPSGGTVNIQTSLTYFE